MSKNAHRSVQNSDAVFLGWQQFPRGKAMALYNIVASGHPSYGSTVLEETLRKLNLRVPPIPFRQKKAKKLRSTFTAQKKI